MKCSGCKQIVAEGTDTSACVSYYTKNPLRVKKGKK